MHFKMLVVLAGVGLIFNSGPARGDSEDVLLKKFQNQNQSAAEKLKEEVTGNLARAASPGKENPIKIMEILRKSLEQLQSDAHLPKAERASLISQVQERLKDVKEAVVEKSKKDSMMARLQPETGSLGLPGYQVGVGQPTYIPPITYGGPRGIAPFSSFTVTPVVGGGGTSVRLGISGTFSIPTMGPLVPIQIPVPSVFYGPGKKFTRGQPESIYTIFLPFRNVESTSVNTTVTVPDGGTAVIGGSQSSSEGRNEFGPPGLSKVPYVNRLFKNVATGKQVSSSRIGVSVRIISMEEEERKLLGK
jgi:Bacterial type II and III secretion system protein